MGKFDGKNFLMLGTTIGSVDMVKYAKSEGAHVIVIDYLPIEKSEAKQYADETFMISTVDIDAIVKLARAKKVDGVFAGASELNLQSTEAVTSAMGLPCYFTREQWNMTENKAVFKELCRKFSIPIAKTYYFDDIPTSEDIKDIEYPVIIKPVDRCASIGMHIANNDKEFLEGYKDAYEKSFCHQVTVEEYIIGNEFSAYYTFIGGECRLSIVFDKYLNREQEGFVPIPEAYVFPSRIQEKYIREVNENVKRMYLSIGLKNAVACVQGVTDGKKIAVFEAGLRLGGTALYNFIEEINGINTMKLMVDYSILGKMEADINLENPEMGGKRGCLLSVLNGGGVVGKINGYEEACKVVGVSAPQMRYKVGDRIPQNGTLQQSHLRFYVIRDTAQELKESIEQIQKLISVTDENGNNMLLQRFDANKLIY